MHPREEPDQPRLRIRGASPRRVLLGFTLFVGTVAWSVAAGLWQFTALSGVVFVHVTADVIRRSEWNGRPIIRALAGLSTFEEGWRAVPRDLFALASIIVASLVNALIFGLIFGSSPTRLIVVGLSVVISIVASVMLIREIRRRSKADDTP